MKQACICTLVLALTVGVSTSAVFDGTSPFFAPEPVYAAGAYADIPDGNLRAGINAYLAGRDGAQRAPDAEILKTELASVTELSLNRMGIEKLDGLENCTHIRRLYLDENRIEDVGPLSGLGSLTHLHISDNRICDFTPLAGLANASAHLYVYALSQEAEGAPLRRTDESLAFDAAVAYHAGAAFGVFDLLPRNANGTYFPSTGRITYGPVLHTDDMTVSYRFSLTESSQSGYGKDVYLGGTVTHEVFVPWCTASFDAGEGAIDGGRDSVTVIEGYPLGWLPAAVRTGYSLAGWEADGVGSGATAVTEGTVITTDTAVRAVWKADSYTLSYELNGGDSVSPEGKAVTYDGAVGPLAVPQRKGYAFTGWLERADGGALVTEGAVWRRAEDGAVYASWSANAYTLRFDAQGGSLSLTSKRVVYDDIYGELPAPVYKGKVFEGWYTGAAGGMRIDPSDDVKTDRDQVLYAHYQDVDRSSIRPVGKNEWKDFEGNRYRFDRKGVMLTGLRKVGKYYYYFDSAGRLLRSGKVRLSGYTLKADARGRITNMPRPNRTSVTSAVKSGRKAKVGWKRLIGVSGYQVQYALDKGFTKEIGVRTVKGGKTLKKTVKRLARGKRYYVRVRGYFLIDGLKVPGKYSKAVRTGAAG
jgi:uncharacterized repeat protein (TIGR02543 family)